MILSGLPATDLMERKTGVTSPGLQGPGNPAPSSPCIGVCTLVDPGICIGCFRSQQEIIDWSTMSEPERLEVMSGLHDRMEAWFDDAEL